MAYQDVAQGRQDGPPRSAGHDRGKVKEMSKRRGHKPQRDIARETAILESSISPGQTCVPALEAMLSEKFPSLPNVDAARIALAVQNFLRGEASILGSQDGPAEQALLTRLEVQDKASAAEVADREALVRGTLARAEKLKLPPEQRAVVAARASRMTDRLAFDRLLETMPKVALVVAGKMTNYQAQGGGNLPRLDPIEIRIKHKVWVLAPGRTHQVPKLVADRYYQMLREQEETQARKDVLLAEGSGAYGKNKQDIVVAQRFDEISRQYGTPTDPMSRLIASR